MPVALRQHDESSQGELSVLIEKLAKCCELVGVEIWVRLRSVIGGHLYER